MFPERLSELLKINHIYQTELAQHVGYTTQAISRWCRGETEPDLKTLTKIANYFNVSVDFLLGNEKNVTKIEQEIKEKIALKKVLVNAGYMKDDEDLTDEELERLMKFVKNNKDFIKEGK